MDSSRVSNDPSIMQSKYLQTPKTGPTFIYPSTWAVLHKDHIIQFYGNICLHVCLHVAIKYTSKQKHKVGAQCRHDTRPSVQLPSVSGVDSELGYFASSDYARYASLSWGFWHLVTLTCDLLIRKLPHRVLLPQKMHLQIFAFSIRLFVFELEAFKGQTDKQTGNTRNEAYNSCNNSAVRRKSKSQWKTKVTETSNTSQTVQ